MLAVAHLYCVVFVASFTSSAAEPFMSVQLMNLKKYVALLLGGSVEGNGSCTEKPSSARWSKEPMASPEIRLIGLGIAGDSCWS